MKRLFGYTCDNCRKFFTEVKYTRKGKKRLLQFCSEECYKKDNEKQVRDS